MKSFTRIIFLDVSFSLLIFGGNGNGDLVPLKIARNTWLIMSPLIDTVRLSNKTEQENECYEPLLEK